MLSLRKMSRTLNAFYGTSNNGLREALMRGPPVLYEPFPRRELELSPGSSLPLSTPEDGPLLG